MSYWPEGMKTEPIGEWPGERTVRPQRSPFSASIGTTVAELQREIRQLGAKNVVLQIDLPPGKFRLDGNPRADAVPSSPGLILTFETKVGAQSYPCDAFTRWEDNLRAIVLSLEALRKVDRYGVTKGGQQYRGFLAIEAATAMPAGFATDTAAALWLDEHYGERGTVMTFAELLRRAKKIAHPDMGGDPGDFQRVMLAEAKLREAGRL